MKNMFCKSYRIPNSDLGVLFPSHFFIREGKKLVCTNCDQSMPDNLLNRWRAKKQNKSFKAMIRQCAETSTQLENFRQQIFRDLDDSEQELV